MNEVSAVRLGFGLLSSDVFGLGLSDSRTVQAQRRSHLGIRAE